MSDKESLKDSDPTLFLNLQTLVHVHYNLHGIVPSAEKAESEYGVDAEVVRSAYLDDDFLAGLAERGIILERMDTESWTSNMLTPMQLIVANQLLDLTDQRSTKKKLQDIGVSTGTYSTWLSDPAFKKYMHTRAEQMLGDNQHEASLALQDNIRKGDLRSIEFFYEMTGKFTRQRAGVAGSVDVHSLIVKIIEIIDEEILDEATQLRIGDRLRRLIASNNAASALMGETPPVGALVQGQPNDGMPEVVPVRKLTLESKDTLL